MATADITSMTVLKQYLSSDGLVDYEKLKHDNWLQENLARIETMGVENLSREEQLAFWLNAYNLTILKAVYAELEKNPSWQGNVSLWSKFNFFLRKRYRIANRKMSLYYLENSIIRKQFKDPRVHFALNCASRSCPFLPTKLFTGETLDDVLEELSADFINNQGGVALDGNTLYLSRIFKWYRKDFGTPEDLLAFINRYWQGEEISDRVQVKYGDYDWSLNS